MTNQIINESTDKFSDLLSIYIEIMNTGKSSVPIDRTYLDDLISYRMFEAYCFVQSKLNLISKTEFYLVIEGYLALFASTQEEESIIAINSIIDILNNYCSNTQLKKFYNQLKSETLKAKLKITV